MSQNEFPRRPPRTETSPKARFLEIPRHEFATEKHLLELISEGIPLPRVLNELCTAVDMQIAGVVSMVVLSEDAGHACLIAESAARFGLRVFLSEPILSGVGQVLGTFEVYCCDPRSPDRSEQHVVERATRLAAAAIERTTRGARRSRPCGQPQGIFERGTLPGTLTLN